MTAGVDVRARLAEGRAALDTAQLYLSASMVRGYSHPDLTRHQGQLHDWYDGLDGLDLTALDADCTTLHNATAQAAEALGEVRSAVAGLPSAWRGQGGAAVTDFIARHCDTAQRLVDVLQTSQNCCATLRDELWQLVDRTVSATLAMTERARPEWRPAAEAVLAGDPDRDAAGQIVDDQVKPFVDNVVRAEWLVTMQSVADAAGTAYRGAITRVGAFGGVVFEVPGGVVAPRVAPGPVRGTGVAPAPQPASPAAGDVGAVAGVPAMAPMPPAAQWAPAAMAPAGRNPLDAFASGIPPIPAMPAVGGGLPTSGLPDPGLPAALPGLGPSDAGLSPHNGSRPMDIPALDVPRLGGPDNGIKAGDAPQDAPSDGAETDKPDDAQDTKDAPDTKNAKDANSDAGAPDSPADEPGPAADEAAGADDPPPPADCPPPAAAAQPESSAPAPAAEPVSPAAEPKAPCEIAADELPQVGE